MTIKAVLIMPGPDGSEVVGQMLEMQWEGHLDWACVTLGALRWERLPDDVNIGQLVPGWDLQPVGPLPGHPLYVAPGAEE